MNFQESRIESKGLKVVPVVRDEEEIFSSGDLHATHSSWTWNFDDETLLWTFIRTKIDIIYRLLKKRRC